ncbi:MAG: DMT family transporter [Okeania sp. SIO2D1]|nr:DMT family transporter [Okeania sp. SIO2D1]
MIRTATDNLQPKLMLVISRALAALRPSLIAYLVVNASRLSGGMENPITFCNLLFVGNMCAAIGVALWFGITPILGELKKLSPKILVGLFINGCLAALLSSLIFIGLQYTSVTNAVLLSRFGPVLYALAGAMIFGKRILKWEWIGFSFITLGVIAIILKTNMFEINRGDLFILASSCVYAATSIIGKIMLSQKNSVKVVVFSRNFISATIFFIIASVLFGPSHFGDTFAGQLWLIMAIYAVLIIILDQFLWYGALEKLDSRTVAKWTVLSPVFGVLFAFLLNGEQPSLTQVIGFVVIMGGVLLTNFSKQKPQTAMKTEMAVSGESSASAA